MTARRVAAVAFLLGGLLPLGGVAPAACAAEGAHAVLVVDTEAPGGQFRYCVALPDKAVTGIELIELASEQHGLQYRLGYGGNVVCQLAGVGYGSDECLKEGAQFWGYWRGDGVGGWEWSSSGGQATRVRDGDVEGWAWGTGNDGTTHPAPPETTFASVCGEPSGRRDRDVDDDRAAKARSGSKNERSDRRGSTRSAPAAVPAAEQQSATKEPQKKHKRAAKHEARDEKRARRKNDARHARPRRESPSPSASHAPAAIASEPTSSDDGPPVGGVIAAVATVGLMGTGILVRRRRVRTG